MYVNDALLGRFLGSARAAIVWGTILHTTIACGVQPNATEIKVLEVMGEERQAAFEDQCNGLAQWPTDAEKARDAASAADMETSIPPFEQFTHRVLSAKYIPANLREHVFGLKKWGRKKQDVLFAHFEQNGARIWLKDTPTGYIVKITSDRLAADGDKWEQVIRDVCGEYLNDPERLLSYTRLAIYKGKGINRVHVTLPHPVQNEMTELWCMGNPEAIWLDGKAAIIEVAKNQGVARDPVSSRVSQRFPPLAEILKGYTTEELAKYVSSDTDWYSRDVALRMLYQRRDQDIVPLLISIYENARKGDEDLRMSVIQTLARMVKEHPGAYRDRVRELIVNDLADKERSGGRMGDVLKNELKRLPATPSNAPSEAQHPVPQ